MQGAGHGAYVDGVVRSFEIQDLSWMVCADLRDYEIVRICNGMHSGRMPKKQHFAAECAASV